MDNMNVKLCLQVKSIKHEKGGQSIEFSVISKPGWVFDNDIGYSSSGRFTLDFANERLKGKSFSLDQIFVCDITETHGSISDSLKLI